MVTNLRREFCFLGLHLQPLQFMTALYREDNLRRLISASPLTKTLEEIKEALKAQAQGMIRHTTLMFGFFVQQASGVTNQFSFYSTEKEMKKTANLATTGDLVPMNIGQLSPRQMVIYQFGSAILHFACDRCSQNSLLLLIAQDIPRVQSSVWGKEALRLGESYYDTENNILFVPKTSLEHAGELAVCIIHAVAQIKAGTLLYVVTTCTGCKGGQWAWAYQMCKNRCTSLGFWKNGQTFP